MPGAGLRPAPPMPLVLRNAQEVGTQSSRAASAHSAKAAPAARAGVPDAAATWSATTVGTVTGTVVPVAGTVTGTVVVEGEVVVEEGTGTSLPSVKQAQGCGKEARRRAEGAGRGRVQSVGGAAHLRDHAVVAGELADVGAARGEASLVRRIAHLRRPAGGARRQRWCDAGTHFTQHSDRSEGLRTGSSWSSWLSFCVRQRVVRCEVLVAPIHPSHDSHVRPNTHLVLVLVIVLVLGISSAHKEGRAQYGEEGLGGGHDDGD